MIIRKAEERDLPAVCQIYRDIHAQEEAGIISIGWNRDVYPTKSTAADALERADLFVIAENGTVVGSAIINQQQVDVYAGASWQHAAPDDEVMVLHTLTVSPDSFGKGYARAFVGFYEEYALSRGCRYLRMDTNAKNIRAREMYARWGYREVSIVPCTFNGLDGVQLVLLEKKL